MNQNYYIFTGGPGSGKTIVANNFIKNGYACVEEVGRQIIQEQVKIGGHALPWKNKLMFRDLMLQRSIETYHSMETNNIVLFDRGIPDVLGYSVLEHLPISDDLNQAINLYSYNSRVFLFPPWLEIFENDSERKQNYSEAVATYHSMVNVYSGAGYDLIDVPFGNIDDRYSFILSRINSSN